MCRKFDAGLIGLIFTLFLTLGSTGVWAGDTVAFSHSHLVLVTPSGRHDFDVEMAITEPQRRLGLMHRPHLDRGAGMLFDYGEPRNVAMWMKNTLISLDMIFIGADGRIISIAQYTKPHSLDVIRSGGAARAVLEVNAGTAARLGLESGDRVAHDIFGTAKD